MFVKSTNRFLNSQQLQAFYAAAQTGQMTLAAKAIHVTQSALSQRIQSLEEQMAVTLFIRDRKGLRLTSEGEMLLQYCRQLNQLEDEMIGRLNEKSKSLRGIIRLGGFSSVMRSVFLPALAPFLRENPLVELRFYIREMHQLPAMLRSGEIDYMVIEESDLDLSMKSHFIGAEVNMLVQKSGTPSSLPYLDHDENDRTTLRYLKLKTARGLHRAFYDDIYSIIDAVDLGLGKAVLPIHLIRGRKGLKKIKPLREMRTSVYLQYHEQPYYSDLHHQFLQTVLSAGQEMLEKQ